MSINILKSLMKPSAYPVPVSKVELVQTHVSWIFLTDTHVFKLKKPVNFGFLDFSTIDRRRFYCNEELRLNRRLCPEIYEAVIELRESASGVSFTGNGHIVDYAVMMKRLPADRMLDILVENGTATTRDMEMLAEVIGRFHSEAMSSAYISTFGTIEKILYNWRENYGQLAPFSGATLPADDLETIRSWVTDFAENNNELFNRRVEQGFIRECDGDMHLENICLADDRAYIFDCIEFNERFRFCDTASDIAFLLMDLEYHQRTDLSEILLKSYAEISGDRDITHIISFYKIYRAVVRGKVESLRMNDVGITEEERKSAKERSIKYFRLARGYIEKLRFPPALFITCGTMGSGKSTLAGELAFELGIRTFSSDHTRKRINGLSPETEAVEAYGEGLYSEEITAATYRELERLAECELAAGRSVIVDASFKSERERSEFAGLAERWNVEFVILMVTCAEKEQKKRLLARSNGVHTVSDGRIELLERQRSGFIPPSDSEGKIIALDCTASGDSITNLVYGELRGL